jgi:hypothetical protein
MATYSTYLGLKLNSSTDPFLLSDFIGNWTILDGSPGVYICTSSSRPSWTSAQAGKLIFMTDWKCLAYWTGTGWLDCRDAAPVFSAGVYLAASIAKGTTGQWTIIGLTTPRTCALAIAVTGTYLVAANANQDVWQRILVDGVGSTANQLGGYREQLRFIANAGVNDSAGMTATSLQVVTGINPGTHTIGVAADIGSTYTTSVTAIGFKAIAWVAATGAGNSL